MINTEEETYEKPVPCEGGYKVGRGTGSGQNNGNSKYEWQGPAKKELIQVFSKCDNVMNWERLGYRTYEYKEIPTHE